MVLRSRGRQPTAEISPELDGSGAGGQRSIASPQHVSAITSIPTLPLCFWAGSESGLDIPIASRPG